MTGVRSSRSRGNSKDAASASRTAAAWLSKSSPEGAYSSTSIGPNRAVIASIMPGSASRSARSPVNPAAVMPSAASSPV